MYRIRKESNPLGLSHGKEAFSKEKGGRQTGSRTANYIRRGTDVKSGGGAKKSLQRATSGERRTDVQRKPDGKKETKGEKIKGERHTNLGGRGKKKS